MPPIPSDWHVEPTTPRTFDIELAKQKLDGRGLRPQRRPAAARQGRQPDRASRLVFPDTDDTYPKAAQFVKEWYGELGIDVSAQELDSRHAHRPDAAAGGGRLQGRLRHRHLGMVREPDPNSLLRSSSATRSATSDSQYCNPAVRRALREQNIAATPGERKAAMAEMQNIIYDEAPYDILFYDSNLDATATTGSPTGRTSPPTATRCSPTAPRLHPADDATAPPSPRPSRAAEPSAGAAAAATAFAGRRRSDLEAGTEQPPMIRHRGARRVVAVVVVGSSWRGYHGERGRRRDAAALRCPDDPPSGGRDGLPRARLTEAAVRPLPPARVVQAVMRHDPVRSSSNFVLFRMMPGSPERRSRGTRT